MAAHGKQLSAVCTVALFFMLFSASSGAAQSKYGGDSIGCIKNLSLYSEYFKQNNYTDALSPWRWVFFNCPKASKNIFIHGARMYKDLIDKESVTARKDILADTLFMIYDKRIELFGEEGKVLGLKGVDVLRYRQSDPQTAFDILSKSIEIEQSASSANVLSSFYQSVVLLFMDGKLTKEQAIARYSAVMQIIDVNLLKTPGDKYFLSAKDAVNRLLFDFVKPDCTLMAALYSTKFEENPSDTVLLQQIISTLQSKCDDADLYLNAVVRLADIQKSSKAYTAIAKIYYHKGLKDKASEYYDKAIDLEVNMSDRSKLQYENAVVVSANVQRSVALCKQAIASNPDNGQAYLLLARHYASGSRTCAEGNEQASFVAKSVYWAAVDLCLKARSVDPAVVTEANSLIASYSVNFPSVDEVFFQGLKIGDPYSISCWFSATTTVRVRK